jgi:hypothetical protein
VALLAASCPGIYDLADGAEAEIEIGVHSLLVHREGETIFVIGYAEVAELAEVRRAGRARQAAP